MRDYSKCILCYKCVDACGEQYQNTFAITVAGRGFDARISTEYANPLPDSACVYCGNCIAVCPTGALMFASEHELRDAAQWDEELYKQWFTKLQKPSGSHYLMGDQVSFHPGWQEGAIASAHFAVADIVAAGARSAIAGHGVDKAGLRVDHADPVVQRIGDVEVAGRIHRNACRKL